SKVLLIDANFRTPALDDVFQSQEGATGFTDLILSGASLEKSIYKTNLANLFVLPGGKPVSSPSYLFDGESVTEILTALRDRFDFVIFDASPLESYSESFFLAPKVDGVIMVVEAEHTRTEVGLKVKKELEAVGANILGVVVNKKRQYIPPIIERLL
ncbi:MAG: CpsD/CapB family tyrosine-protein kinase, partial [Candidatus Binatia bacterium]